MSVVSDADFPIGNAEKGMVDIRIDLRWEEETLRMSVPAFRGFQAGERSNVVPDRAVMTRTMRSATATPRAPAAGDESPSDSIGT